MFVLVVPAVALIPFLIVVGLLFAGGLFFVGMLIFNREVLETEPGAGALMDPEEASGP